MNNPSNHVPPHIPVDLGISYLSEWWSEISNTWLKIFEALRQEKTGAETLDGLLDPPPAICDYAAVYVSGDDFPGHLSRERKSAVPNEPLMMCVFELAYN